MAINAADLLVNVRANVDTAQRRLQAVDDRLDKMGKKTFPVAAKAAKVFGAAAVAGFGVLGSQAVTGAVVGLTASVVALSGALAAVPAGVAALVGVFAAVKVGMMGVSDAMKALGKDAAEFDEAIKDLAPSAQEFMRALRGMRDEAKHMRLHVQQELFRGLGKEVQALGGVYLPLLERRLSGITQSLNVGTREFSRMLRQGNRVADVEALLKGSESAALGLTRAVRNVVEGFLDLARGGQRSLNGIGASITKISDGFRAWAAEARNAGRVQGWIDTGFAALKALGGALANVGSALQGVFRAAASVGGSGGPFAVLGSVTKALADTVNSLGGQQALRAFFTAASQAGQVLVPVLGAVLQTIGSLAPVLANIATGVAPGLVDLLKAIAAEFGTLGPAGTTLGESLGELLRSLIPLVPKIGDLIRMVVSAVQAVSPFGPQLLGIVAALYGLKGALAVTKGVGALADGVKSAGKGLSAARTHSLNFAAGLRSSQSASSAFTGKMGTLGGAVRSMVSGITTAIGAMARFAAQAVLTAARFALSAARMAVSMAVTVARVVAGFVLMGVQAMLAAGRMAAAWIIAMGPIGWVIAAVVALVALIVLNWDTVKAATVAVWNAVVGHVRRVVGLMVAIVRAQLTLLWTVVRTIFAGVLLYFRTVWNLIAGVVRIAINLVLSVVRGTLNSMRQIISGVLNVVKGLFSGNFSQVLAGVKQIMGGLIGFLTTIPRSILGALGDLGGLLFSSGKAIIQGLVNGIKSMGGAAKDAVGGVLSAARNLLPFSPAKEGPFSGKGWTLYSGRSIGDALAQGMSDRTDAVRRAALEAARAAAGPLADLGQGDRPAGARSPLQGAGSGTRPQAPADLARQVPGRSLSLTFQTINPVAEPQSVTTNKALARAGALGLV